MSKNLSTAADLKLPILRKMRPVQVAGVVSTEVFMRIV